MEVLLHGGDVCSKSTRIGVLAGHVSGHSVSKDQPALCNFSAFLAGDADEWPEEIDLASPQRAPAAATGTAWPRQCGGARAGLPQGGAGFGAQSGGGGRQGLEVCFEEDMIEPDEGNSPVARQGMAQVALARCAQPRQREQWVGQQAGAARRSAAAADLWGDWGGGSQGDPWAAFEEEGEVAEGPAAAASGGVAKQQQVQVSQQQQQQQAERRIPHFVSRRQPLMLSQSGAAVGAGADGWGDEDEVMDDDMLAQVIDSSLVVAGLSVQKQ